MQTKPNISHEYNTASRIGVLLVNLGSPSSPTTKDVRRYLKIFLADRRVIEAPRLLWWLILNGIILNTRPKRIAASYRKIWTDQGSPLIVISKQQQQALTAKIKLKYDDSVCLALAMRYGSPSIATGLAQLRSENIDRLLILPLYPQYSATTTGSVFDAVSKELRQWRQLPECRFINQYYDHPKYIEALARSVIHHRTASHTKSDDTVLLISFHGIPEAYSKAGDPYLAQCQKTGRLLAQALSLSSDQYRISFQSRFGTKRWLTPYTDHTLIQLVTRGVKKVDVICPGFSTDSLETLEEIAIKNQRNFLQAGGKQFKYISCLNDHPQHIDMLSQLIEQHLFGWSSHGLD